MVSLVASGVLKVKMKRKIEKFYLQATTAARRAKGGEARKFHRKRKKLPKSKNSSKSV